MGPMNLRVHEIRRRGARLAFVLAIISGAQLAAPAACRAQLNYVARFTVEKESFLLGEPIFCDFKIQNTGARVFSFSYRSPSRALNRELEQEPRFTVTSKAGGDIPDPAARPCGGVQGSVVYGSVSLPPGQTHTERWLLNQWAAVTKPGRYRVRAERRLPLFSGEALGEQTGERPAAYAVALSELTLDVLPATDPQLEEVFRPVLKTLDQGTGAALAESVLVVTTLPQPFLLERLETMASAPAGGQRWDRRQALDGLARLGTPEAWETISKIATGRLPPSQSSSRPVDISLRAYAVLLLAEKGDARFLPPLLELISTSPAELRGDVLRALGLFRDPRANQVLFERLHSGSALDRQNAILGLKELESRDVVPALLAMLQDPEPQVRQVAHFALESLTGMKFKLPSRASRQDSARVSAEWHAWWREKGANFTPLHQPPCHDW